MILVFRDPGGLKNRRCFSTQNGMLADRLNFFSPLITSKFSLYQIFRPNEREPYLKARAALIDGSDCLNLGCFFKFVNNIRSCSASEMFLLNNSDVIVSGGWNAFLRLV